MKASYKLGEKKPESSNIAGWSGNQDLETGCVKLWDSYSGSHSSSRRRLGRHFSGHRVWGDRRVPEDAVDSKA